MPCRPAMLASSLDNKKLIGRFEVKACTLYVASRQTSAPPVARARPMALLPLLELVLPNLRIIVAKNAHGHDAEAH